jgi:hypothetical protein
MAEMSDDEKDLYLDVLREGTTPFDRFVARGSMADAIDIPGPRKAIDRFLFRAIKQTQQDNSTRLIPILGSAGSGKTHAYWAYKNIERRLNAADAGDTSDLPEDVPKGWSIVYVPSPPAATRILLHVYTCLLDELSVSVLKTVADVLVDRWGGYKKKKLGIFGGQDIEDTIQTGIREYPGIFADAVKCLCLYALDKEKSGLAERWLLGEDLEETELDVLGINSVIESDDICLAMIKLICENAGKAIILYFDELESPYRMHGPEAEQKFLETLKRIYNEVKNLVIIIAVLKEIWPRILEIADQALRSRMEQERELKPFSFDDLLLYFAKAMNYFWSQNNLNPPVSPLFPLNDDVLKVIYNKTDGNQRSIIKLVRIFVDKILEEDVTLEELLADTTTQATAQPPVKVEASPEVVAEVAAVAAPAAVAAKAPSGDAKNLVEQIEALMQQEEYIIEANPASVTGALLKSIKVLAEKFGKTIKLDLDFNYMVGKRSYNLAGCVEYEGKKYGLEVPAIKTFNRTGGVAAFYALKRLADAISTQKIDAGILIVPENTSGAKFVSMLKKYEGKLFLSEFSEDSAKFLIQQALTQPTLEAYNTTKIILGELPAYDAPPPPYSDKPKTAPAEGEGEESDGDAGESSPSGDAPQ